MLNISRFEKRQAKGEPFFPAFLMISVTERCNLSCSGCWVSHGGQKSLTASELDEIITAGKRKGSYFFGILGGEPLMSGELFSVMAKHRDCYFQLFTNGTLITDRIALEMRRLGNITPMISIEGLKDESAARRGRNDVYERTLAGVRACRKARLIFGAAASICKSNFDELVSREYIDFIAREGALYLWYYIYRPAGENPRPENALDREQIIALRRFIVEQRRDAPLFVIETYWDDKGKALCPGATGLSHHISPSGQLEFCPPLQMATERIGNADVGDLFAKSTFLADLRKMTAENSRGCILLDNPQRLALFLDEHNAVETASRSTFLSELKKMQTLPSHALDVEIPEQNIFYKWMKRKYFFGFGAYG